MEKIYRRESVRKPNLETSKPFESRLLTRKRMPKNSEGFTRVELMISTVVLSVIFAGGFGALHQGNRLIEIARDETRAGQILQSEIEDLRTLNWT